MIPVLYVFAYFLGGLAVALIFPALVAGSYDELSLVPDFLITSALLIFLAGALMLSLRGRERRLQPAQRYFLAAVLWIVLPIFGALPLVFSMDGLPVLNAYFEAVSGLTTTGASVLPAPERLPKSIVFWLAMLQWLGGALTLLVIVLVLAPHGVGGLPEAHARLIEHGGLPERRRLLLVLRDIMPLYVGATGLAFMFLALTGLDSFDALCLAFASVSTGGFTPRSGEIGAYVSSTGVVLLIIFMVYGATSVLWHRDIVRHRWAAVAARRESWWLIGLCAGFGLVSGLAFYQAAGGSAFLSLRDGLFTATSLITTTGLESRYASFQILTLPLVILLVAIGAASFSTGGGIKLFRVGAMLVQSKREMNRLIYPHAIRPAKFGTQAYDMQVMKAIWSGFIAFIAATLLLSWLVAAEGVPYEGALVAALSVLSNAGPVYSSSWAEGAGWQPYAGMSDVAKLGLCAAMVLGRLEVVAVLGLVFYAGRRA